MSVTGTAGATITTAFLTGAGPLGGSAGKDALTR